MNKNDILVFASRYVIKFCIQPTLEVIAKEHGISRREAKRLSLELVRDGYFDRDYIKGLENGKKQKKPKYKTHKKRTR